MLIEYVKFVVMLFVFGTVYWIINFVIVMIDSVLPVAGETRLVIFFVWSIIPIVYFVGRARELWQQKHLVDYPGGGR